MTAQWVSMLLWILTYIPFLLPLWCSSLPIPGYHELNYLCSPLCFDLMPTNHGAWSGEINFFKLRISGIWSRNKNADTENWYLEWSHCCHCTWWYHLDGFASNLCQGFDKFEEIGFRNPRNCKQHLMGDSTQSSKDQDFGRNV